MRVVIGLLGTVGATFAAAFIGSLASVRAPEYYRELDKPEWAPPSGVFGPVWTVLYALIAAAGWMVWRAGDKAGRSFALGLFWSQLLLNAMWSWTFFQMRLGPLSVANILLLWGCILVGAFAIGRVNRWAGLLFVPYLAWVTFAAFLNIAIWRLNPQGL